MTQQAKYLTGIDVGTTKVCAIIGNKADNGIVEVIGYGIAPCNGLTKGNVSDVTETQRAIREAVSMAEKQAGIKVSSAYVGVTGAHVAFENRSDTLDWAGKVGVITAEDLERVPVRIAASTETTGRKVLHVIPTGYTLDGENGVRSPLGMHTRHVRVESHVVTGASPFIERLISAVEAAGIQVADLVMEPLASGEAVLRQEEKNRTVAVVDIGGGTTDVVVFRNGNVDYTGVIPVGGYQFTNDIALMYGAPYDAAEEVKLEYATAEPDTVSIEEEVLLKVIGHTDGVNISRLDLCQLARERAQELVRLIKLKLREADVSWSDDVTVVLTGGASKLPGLDTLAGRQMPQRVRLGAPNGRTDVPDELRHPSYSTGVGLLMWALDRQQSGKTTGMLKGYAEFAKPSSINDQNGEQKEDNKRIGRLFGSLKKIF